MNILHLIPRMNYFGGTAKKLRFLIKHSKYGCRHLCAVGKTDETQWLHGLNLLSLEGNDKIMAEVKKACSIVKNYDIDLIAGHFFHMSLVAYLVSRRLKIPFIYQDHGIVIGETIIKYPLRLWILLKAQLVVVNSYATAKMFNKRYPFTKNKIRVVYNGINFPLQCANYDLRKIIGIPKNVFLVGTIGSYLQLRKHDILIKAFAEVCKQKKNVHLVCLGEGGTEKERLEKLAEKLAPQNIHFLPRTEYVGNFLQHIDIYVNAATSEGFGIATCEAMLMKKPVIAAKAGALPEYCFHGHNAILVPPDDPVVLGKAIDKLLDDGELRKSLGERASADISRRFSVDKYVRENNAVCYEAVGEMLTI